MRTFASISALIAVANAGKVHEFFAENHFICEMCKTVIEFAANGQERELDQFYQRFPKLEERITYFMNQADLINLAEPEQTCQNIQLCETPSLMEDLLMEQPIDLSHHIESVNSNPNSTWVAGTNAKFDGMSIREVKKLMGTVVDPDWVVNAKPIQEPRVVNDNIPAHFDARDNWPECESVINHVRDQSNCGSCWAHGTTEALNDRICISTGGNFTTLLSVSDTTGCCDGIQCFSFGCNGGQIGFPWRWFKRQGVVTGGDYGTTGTCYNYTMEKCAHHVTSETLPSCDDVVTAQPACLNTCPDDSDRIYADDKHFSQSAYWLHSIDAIKADIVQYGSVTSAFTVYEDFLTYKSGVYTHQTGAKLGGHAIKTIGWGTENGEDYWLCVNSWNNTWGDMGLFKIKMGECGIDGQMHAGVPGA